MAGAQFGPELVRPGPESVGPRFDGDLKRGIPEEETGCLPSVIPVRDGSHGGGCPLAFAQFAPFEAGGDGVVSVFVDIGFDAQFLTDDAFDGETSAVDGGVNVFDDDRVRVPVHGIEGG